MAAYVVTPSPENWPVIKEFLESCGEGAIVLAPELTSALGKDIEGTYLPDYEFSGGDADIWIDVVTTTDSFEFSYLKSELSNNEELQGNEAS
jgi:hypothetical protein